MTYQMLIVEKRNKVGVITMNRPQARNALNRQLVDEIIDALHQFDEDPEINVIVLRGAGNNFCSGHDFAELYGKNLADLRTVFGHSIQLLQAISANRKVVIAAVSGYAVAMGCALAAGCDLAVASAGAKFQTPGVNIGFACVTPMSAIYRSIGRKKCLELIISGEPITAAEAERIGLVNKVVPEAEFESAVFAMAEKIAGKAPLALQFVKKAFYNMADMEQNQAYNYAVEMISANADTDDAREGMSAFIEKRPPRPWTGH